MHLPLMGQRQKFLPQVAGAMVTLARANHFVQYFIAWVVMDLTKVARDAISNIWCHTGARIVRGQHRPV